ncbi:rubrerythrin [delta proteobacterium NaphS2]|nr:rubrerythrin [delta proteobacterium NaphS2]
MILGFNADEVFRTAIEIEKNGVIFYKNGRNALAEDDVKEIFSQLEKDEEAHLDKLRKMRAELPSSAKQPTDYDPTDDIKRKTDEETNQYIQDTADMNVFRNVENVEKYTTEIKTVEDALRLAIQFEKDAITFFLIMRDLTEDDKGKQFVGGILSEEKEHLKILSRRLRKEVGCEKMSTFQMPVCANQTAMGPEQARAANLDEPCDDSRGAV